VRAHVRLPSVLAAAVALGCATLVMVATRGGLRLSPDSINYLSVADALRHGRGLTDLSGDQLTVFGPVLPLLLTPCGRSVVWARLVGAACIAAITLLMYLLLRRRCRTTVALAACAVLGASQSLLLDAASVYSEMPYLVCSLAVFVVLLPRATVGRCAGAGALAALGFVSRYAGASLVVTGAMVVAIATWRLPRAERLRSLGAYVGASAVVGGSWIVHNLIVAGQPLGNRFSGGSSEPWGRLFHLAFSALGQAMLGDSLSMRSATAIGSVAFVVAVFSCAVWGHRSPLDPIAIGMLVYAATNFVLPVVARALTLSDLSSRVMSPMLVPIVYAAALAADAALRGRVGAGLVVILTSLWVWQGLDMAHDVPDMPSSGSRTIYSAQLHDLIDDLPRDAQLLSNNPWGVWWQNHREPTLFAFTRPRPGNGAFPISVERTLHVTCTEPTYLAWFPSLQNAGKGPDERRPDLLEVVDLVLEQRVVNGELYRVVPHDPASCNS
jgi:hypothetical protein